MNKIIKYILFYFQVHPSQGSVRTMTVEEGHVLNIDGVNNSAANKYKQDRKGERSMSAVSRGSAFQVTSDVEDGGGHGGGGGGGGNTADRVSVLSGASGRSKTTSQLEAASKLPWYRGVTWKDVKDITPTVLILIGGLLIMIFVIPYAFSSVIKQLEAEAALNAAHERAKEELRNHTEMLKALNEANSTGEPLTTQIEQ